MKKRRFNFNPTKSHIHCLVKIFCRSRGCQNGIIRALGISFGNCSYVKPYTCYTFMKRHSEKIYEVEGTNCFILSVGYLFRNGNQKANHSRHGEFAWCLLTNLFIFETKVNPFNVNKERCQIFCHVHISRTLDLT